ncbi:uncharacterized protein [Temnothorax nylanderi]|uniref:uncharacterized protein n=1 Tax=Temnothorax nylanderi TaxID=102681 RepID=UPI003A8C76EE
MLNALSNGPGKTVKQWQTVWRDLKSNTSKKALKLRNERNRTGNFPVTSEPLDSLDSAFCTLGCIGLEYVEGTPDCPDSIPEEEELQVQLENGNEDVLLLTPSTTTISNMLNTSTRELENNDVGNYPDASEMPQECADVDDDLSYRDVLDCVNNQSSIENEAPAQNTQSRKRKRAEKTTSNQRKKQRQRIGIQLQEAREKFRSIAENHAESLHLFSKAAMMTAETDRARNTLEERRVDLEERRLKMEERRLMIDKLLIWKR